MKHTPGPWVWYDKHEKALLSGGDKDKNQCYPVVMIVDADGHRSPQEADKRLIAAAPDMLEALEGLLETVRHERKTGLCQGSEWVRKIDRADDAIAKATDTPTTHACSWCGRELEGHPGHGICEECKEKEFAELGEGE